MLCTLGFIFVVAICSGLPLRFVADGRMLLVGAETLPQAFPDSRVELASGQGASAEQGCLLAWTGGAEVLCRQTELLASSRRT